MEIIAHRGMHDDSVMENSADAFMGVLASVADGIETDIRMTKDDICIFYHDPKTPDGKDIAEITYSELCETHDHVQRLEYGLNLLNDYHGIVNIEVKHIFGEKYRELGKRCVEKLALVLGQYNIENIVVSSFSIKHLKSAKALLPEVKRAYLVPSFLPTCIALRRAKRNGCDAIHFSVSQTRRPFMKFFIKRAHKNNMIVRIYTVNDQQQLAKLEKLNIDGIFTDKVVELSKN